jgi:hypothetical protein
MPFTKCPNCRKVQLISHKLANKKIGCMGERCGSTFKAEEYRMHSGPLSKIIFLFFIGFALYELGRWLWRNGITIIDTLG